MGEHLVDRMGPGESAGDMRRPGGGGLGAKGLVRDELIHQRDKMIDVGFEDVGSGEPGGIAHQPAVDRPRVHSVDINPIAVAQARRSVSDRVKLTEGDSVKFLNTLLAEFLAEGKTIDLLYLDSFDLDWDYWYPSAAHHLKELCAAMRILTKGTLVVVDDCPLCGDYVSGAENQIRFVRPPAVGGKGRLVAEFAASVGAKLEFAEYQAGWTGF